MTSPNIYGQSQRNSLFLEDAAITKIDRFPGDQFIIRMQAPKCAEKALAGSFVHIQCDDKLPMRRPLSIMRSNPDDGWIEVLFKIVGEGLRALSTRLVGETVSIIGPIGNGFSPSSKRPNKLLIGGGVGIPPMIFLAETLKFSDPSARPLVIMGSEIPFPFELATSGISTDWAPAGVDSTMPLLESWNIPARLTSMSNFPGCHVGFVTDLSRSWLASLSESDLAECEIFSCGPTPMLRAVTELANEFKVPCQVSLEEFMACGVGGCAGCTVSVRTEAGEAMQRVCVDGPVFDGDMIFGTR